MVRKTVSVAKVIEMANTHLQVTEDTTEAQQTRKGVYGLLEAILFEADAYKGFSYLPGIVQYEDNEVVDITDDTRRCYYTHPKLRS